MTTEYSSPYKVELIDVGTTLRKTNLLGVEYGAAIFISMASLFL